MFIALPSLCSKIALPAMSVNLTLEQRVHACAEGGRAGMGPFMLKTLLLSIGTLRT